MKIYRVFNGQIADGLVHRIVRAPDADAAIALVTDLDAIAYANRAAQKPRGYEAVEVNFTMLGVEVEEFDGGIW